MDSDDSTDYKNTTDLKIVFIGDSGVGKTTLIQRYIKETFESETQPTVGSMFFAKNVTLENDVNGNQRKFRLQVKNPNKKSKKIQNKIIHT